MQPSDTHPERSEKDLIWHIYAAPVSDSTDATDTTSSANSTAPELDWEAVCAEATQAGFNTLLVPLEALSQVQSSVPVRCVQAASSAGLRLLIDLPASALSGSDEDPFTGALGWLPTEQRSAGLLLRGVARMSPPMLEDLVTRLREWRSDLLLTVWTPGLSPTDLQSLAPLSLDGVYSSLPWWNLRHGWLIEEYERLHAVAPVIAPVVDPRAPPRSASQSDMVQRLAIAMLAGDGLMAPGGHGLRMPVVEEGALGARIVPKKSSGPSRLTGSLAQITALFRGDAGGRLLLVNPDPTGRGSVSRALIERRLPNGFVLTSQGPAIFHLEAGGWEFVPVDYADYISSQGTTSGQMRRSLSSALTAPRIAIEDVQPAVDNGAFPAKRSLGETIAVRANIFMDGHEELAAELLWRSSNETTWQRSPMSPLGNDRWEAKIAPRRLGRYVFAINAWHDRWRSYSVQLQKKAQAGVNISLEVEEGRRMLAACLARGDEGDEESMAVIETALDAIGAPSDGSGHPKRRRSRTPVGPRASAAAESEAHAIPPGTPEQVAVLLDEQLARAMYNADERPFETTTPVLYPLSIERNEASFSSWYELFPRSQSQEEGRHGTLLDVIDRLPEIRRMGFDVLYFPPIHPIGRANRKGRNNSLQAGPDDPGSPYAIGSPDGGHDAVHPELGTLNDFRELIVAAQRHGMEIALDFAIQCSPDHPWLREHPDWFNWRADGTLKYAENPPKKYEDIVNPDFYSPLASTPRQAALWRALRDIVLFWIQQGVRIFRVDNPHTKPLPFWQWMLREVRDRHPDTIFLSEAFTRPAMMYRLGKIGYSQSYTYFTWRNTKAELTEYMTELNSSPVREFFRPNFFVNTPDINPWFLQTSGRAGFLIRAVLAGTLSGSWGMYNGFELCVADPVPGKEEYLDSEKYQFRRWDMETPGNIIEEITRLNRIRRNHPALQSHLGIKFHHVDNDQIIFYSRHSAEGDSIVLVAVSLDPHRRQSGTLTLPTWEWGLGDDAQASFHDLYEDSSFSLRGRHHRIELSPERPFVLWAVVENGRGTA